MATSEAASSDDEHTDDELPTSSVAELTVDPKPKAKDEDTNNGDGGLNDALHQRRSATHSKLRAYEAKRRTAYESKLQSSSLYWHAFRTLMHDSLLETQKADLLARGWTHASTSYAANMTSVGEWAIDDKGAPITDARKKKRIFEANEKGAVGGGVGVAFGADNIPMNDKHVPLAVAEFYREEKCGSMVQHLADSAGSVASQYEEMVKYMNEEVLPELSSLLDHLKSEVMVMEKLGDSIMGELEAAEDEVCKAWEVYYNKMVEFNGSSSDEIKVRLEGAHAHDGTVLDFETAVRGCADVWVEEMRYRMAVAFLSSVWEKCSSELSKLFLSMKDAECNRRNQMKELLIKAAQRQERLWLGLPAVINPVLKELIEWPMDRKFVEDEVQHSIRDRAQAIQLDEAENKKADEPKADAPGLTGVYDDDGNFELSSPLVSDLMYKAKVIEKRSAGMMSSWKLSLAVITSDSFLHLFELPPTCKLHSGSAPEVAFQNLIPPVVVPSMEGVKVGVKFPSSRYWFDHLAPAESLALPNCTVSFKDEKAPNTFEIVETILTSGASKMFTKTMNRKMQIRAIDRNEAKDFVDALKSSKLVATS
mmetsp:Transcript_749/g.1364  ORF Transcript_749/g.1364 Transcript_749/m.1364 type:complete len:592 (+) Transcript_749:123-1898(+)